MYYFILVFWCKTISAWIYALHKKWICLSSVSNCYFVSYWKIIGVILLDLNFFSQKLLEKCNIFVSIYSLKNFYTNLRHFLFWPTLKNYETHATHLTKIDLTFILTLQLFQSNIKWNHQIPNFPIVRKSCYSFA